MKRRQLEDGDWQWTESAVRAWALRLLSYRGRSSAELRERLTRRGAPAGLVAAVIESLERAGLIDDEAFAGAWVEARRGSSPRGTRLLRAELRQKGLDRELIERALTESGEEVSLAVRAAEKKARALVNEPGASFARKLRAFLLRRGFDQEVAAEAVRSVMSERADEGEW